MGDISFEPFLYTVDILIVTYYKIIKFLIENVMPIFITDTKGCADIGTECAPHTSRANDTIIFFFFKQ